MPRLARTSAAGPARLWGMAIESSYLGSVKVSGDEAKAFTRKILRGRGTQAAARSAAHGRKLVAEYLAKGSANIELHPAKQDGKR